MSEYDDFEAMWGNTEAEIPVEKGPLPEGKYEAVVQHVQVKQWDDGGKTIDWTFQVCGGEHDGRKTYMGVSMTPQKAGKIKGHFALFGLDKLPTWNAIEAAFPTLENRRVKISVSSYNDKLYTHLNALADALTTQPAPAPPVTAPAPAATQAALPGIPAQTTPFD